MGVFTDKDKAAAHFKVQLNETLEALVQLHETTECIKLHHILQENSSNC
jgi:hypothetical protein